MTKHILLLGGGQMQLPAIELAHARGLHVVCFDGNPDALAKGLADEFVVCDISDRQLCAAEAARHRAAARLDGVLTVGTDFSTTVAWVAQELGLPGIPYEVALRAKDKGLMRACFDAAGVSSPRYVVLERGQAPDARLPFGLPCVVKPSDNMGARGVRLVRTEAEREQAVLDAWRLSPTGRCIVEEYIDGPEFSLDSLVQGGRLRRLGLADRHIVFPPFFVEIGHSLPTAARPDVVEALWAEFEKGVRAIGITDGAAKGDVKWSSRGPVIGEIAARLSGGYMSGWTYPLSSGRSATVGALELALGEPLGAVPDDLFRPVAERAWISIPGTLRSVAGLDEVRAMPGVEQVFVTLKPGRKLVFPTNNVEKAGNVVCTGATAAEADQRARLARNRLVLELEPGDAATEAFLFGSDPSPWWFPEADSRHAKPGAGAGGRDPYGNSVADLLGVLGLTLASAPDEPRFWRALHKGGLQGVRYAFPGRFA